MSAQPLRSTHGRRLAAWALVRVRKAVASAGIGHTARVLRTSTALVEDTLSGAKLQAHTGDRVEASVLETLPAVACTVCGRPTGPELDAHDGGGPVHCDPCWTARARPSP